MGLVAGAWEIGEVGSLATSWGGEKMIVLTQARSSAKHQCPRDHFYSLQQSYAAIAAIISILQKRKLRVVN